jgi:hypothetical protein
VAARWVLLGSGSGTGASGLGLGHRCSGLGLGHGPPIMLPAHLCGPSCCAVLYCASPWSCLLPSRLHRSGAVPVVTPPAWHLLRLGLEASLAQLAAIRLPTLGSFQECVSNPHMCCLVSPLPCGPLRSHTLRLMCRAVAHAGRCSVCVVQRKGRCGTDSAPKRCLRRQAIARNPELAKRKWHGAPVRA